MITLPAMAQMGGGMMGGQNQGGMMQMMQNRMQMMAQNPMHKAMMLVQALPDMDSLKLDDGQKEQLESLRQSLNEQRQNTMKAHMSMMQGMKNMDPATMDPQQMKGQMQGMMSSMIAMRTSTIETYQNMLKVLDEGQRTQVKNMDSKALTSAMMNQMPMTNMMKMMNGGCPMMKGGMKGMMNGGNKMQPDSSMNNGSGNGMGAGMSGHAQH